MTAKYGTNVPRLNKAYNNCPTRYSSVCQMTQYDKVQKENSARSRTLESMCSGKHVQMILSWLQHILSICLIHRLCIKPNIVWILFRFGMMPDRCKGEQWSLVICYIHVYQVSLICQLILPLLNFGAYLTWLVQTWWIDTVAYCVSEI